MRSLGWYAVLEGKKVRMVSNVMEWAPMFEKSDGRRVGLDEVDGVKISTMFLGLDHGYGYGPPLWFETMVFGGPLDEEMERYTTYEEAEAGHKAMVERVKAAK